MIVECPQMAETTRKLGKNYSGPNNERGVDQTITIETPKHGLSRMLSQFGDFVPTRLGTGKSRSAGRGWFRKGGGSLFALETMRTTR